MITTVLDSNVRTFKEGASSLDGKENTLVKVHTDGTLVAATAGVAQGVMQGKLQAGMKDIAVRMLGKNGTVRVIQSGAITPGSQVMQDPDEPTKVKAFSQAAGMRCLGTKLGATAGAAGDIVELLDVVETVVTKQTVAAPTTAEATITALTFTAGGATGPEVTALKAEVAKLAADVKALRDKLVSAGVISVAS